MIRQINSTPVDSDDRFLSVLSVVGLLSSPPQVELRPGSGLGVEREWARLERDLEEASRRLAMAHREIRRLTDELESARMTQSAYGEARFHTARFSAK